MCSWVDFRSQEKIGQPGKVIRLKKMDVVVKRSGKKRQSALLAAQSPRRTGT